MFLKFTLLYLVQACWLFPPKTPLSVRTILKTVELLLTEEKVTTKHFNNKKLHYNMLQILKAVTTLNFDEIKTNHEPSI